MISNIDIIDMQLTQLHQEKESLKERLVASFDIRYRKLMENNRKAILTLEKEREKYLEELRNKP